MSETNSSPSVHLPPNSPFSSLSSSSAPRSEPTSDEQPDLGAFNTVLREWNYLQPPQRVPVQTRPPTSSTMSTFQPDVSILGSDSRAHSRDSRFSSRSAPSGVSSFTRPPSSSVHPDGSTVWNQSLVASYLYSSTPSNDMISEDYEGEQSAEADYQNDIHGEYTISPPNSLTSTALTVEIASEVDSQSFDSSNSSRENHLESPPEVYQLDSGIPINVPLQGDGQRIDSRETADADDIGRGGRSSESHGDTSLLTRDQILFGDRTRLPIPSSSQHQLSSESDSSFVVLSQPRPPPTITTSSFSRPNLSSLSNVTPASSLPAQQVSSSSAVSSSKASTSTSTLINALLNRSRNPIPPRGTSDSSFTGSGSSNLSLVSYQIPETPQITNDEESEHDAKGPNPASTSFVQRNGPSNTSAKNATNASVSGSLQVKNHTTTAFPNLNPPNIFSAPKLSQSYASTSAVAPSKSLTSSPLPNPYSPLPVVEQKLPELGVDRHFVSSGLVKDIGVVDDSNTPFETVLFNPPRDVTSDFLPIQDDNDLISSGAESSAFPLKEDIHAGDSSVHTSAYERTRDPVYLSSQAQYERSLHVDDDDDDDHEVYSYRYSHTPRSYAQALTPKSAPPPIEPQTPPAATTTQTKALLGQLGIFTQPQTLTKDVIAVRQEPPQFQPSSRNPFLHLQAEKDIRTEEQTLVANQQQVATQIQHTSTNPFLQFSNLSSHTDAITYDDNSPQKQTGHNQRYPHSLLGLHALPASIGPSSAASVFNSGGIAKPIVEPLVETESSSEVGHPDEDLDRPLPSLGYLDEALSFIAAERAKWSAARETFPDSVDPQEGRQGSDEEEPGFVRGAKQTIENELEHPKRKRRRKRPARSHGSAPGASSGVEIPVKASKGDEAAADNNAYPSQAPPGTSPKKKRRSKSASASASASRSASRHPAKDAPAKKNKQEKEFLIALPPVPLIPIPGTGKDKSPITILRRPLNISDDDLDDDSDVGGRTPTNLGKVELGALQLDATPNLMGTKGKRLGRKERDREKEKWEGKKNLQKENVAVGDNDSYGFSFEYLDADDDDDDGGDTPEEDEDNDDENDSISKMSLLQPPKKRRERSRRRARDTAHIHNQIGVGGTNVAGVYKSIPGSPRAHDVDELEDDGIMEVPIDDVVADAADVFSSKPVEVAPAAPVEKRKRTRSKRKSLTHARSDPELRLTAEQGGSTSGTVAMKEESSSVKSKKGKQKMSGDSHLDILEMDRNELQKFLSVSASRSALSLMAPLQKNQPPPDSKRGRILFLGRKLMQLFPEQYEELRRVITRIERQGATAAPKAAKSASGNLDFGVGSRSFKSAPIAVPGAKIKKGSQVTENTFEFDEDFIARDRATHGNDNLEEEEEDEEIDPRGRPPKKGDTLIHVFIDHSNILIGLLSHLKKHPAQRKIAPSQYRGLPLPTVLTKTTTEVVSNKIDPASAFSAVKPTAARPLPTPLTGDTSSNALVKRQQTIVNVGNHPIALPSFATVSRSLPTGSILRTLAAPDKANSSEELTIQFEKDAVSEDGYTVDIEEPEINLGPGSLFVGSVQNKTKSPLRHLWHSALTFILERGRPITRRVVVTSSPLYQPMESIERLGYELRVFIRVPDLGDGMDRERGKEKNSSGKSASGKSAQSSPVVTAVFSGLSPKKTRPLGHARHLSGYTSAESGSGGGTGSGNASGGGGGSFKPYSGITNGSSPQTKIKYREQGVDELLQLKLHQALAATDVVPEGSTIVLATGDGNMGQFNEDGFLGPVRTALKRGWKVELYAWEDGLSRAWRREFGEWERKGMFRIIAMEEFASGLVEAPEWS